MNSNFFNKAKPIFVQDDRGEAVVSCGYRADFEAAALQGGDSQKSQSYKINITGRSFYRLYINGEIVMHGPARTAHGYLRVDEIDITRYIKNGTNRIAIEQISFGKPFGGYSNHIVLEDGIIIFEIFDCDGNTLAYSSDVTPCVRLKNRNAKADRKSHCREVTELVMIDKNYFAWRECDCNEQFNFAKVFGADFNLLPRGMNYPDLKVITGANLTEFGTFSYSEEKNEKYEPTFYEKWHEEYYANLSNHIRKDICCLNETAGGIDVNYIENGVSVNSNGKAFLMYDFKESYVGFVGFTIKTDSDVRIDIVATELMELDGSNKIDFNTATRLYVKKGEYTFVHFDPSLVRYVRIYVDGKASFSISNLHVVNYSYPDLNEGYFMCSDDDLNRLYNAARKTLILNTLDIFMDCPDRERGGWLCDSFWTARAATQMLGDTKVERAFIENFLLTDAKRHKHGLFPGSYPGNSPAYPCDEISTWSFWLLAEIVEYVKRTKDFALVELHKDRIDAFIEGVLDMRGPSGLLENLPIVFIDWSQANNRANTHPISVPANALFAYALRKYSKLIDDSGLLMIAEEIYAVLRDAVDVCGEYDRIPDGLTYESGTFTDNGVYSEAAHFTSVWSELFDIDTKSKWNDRERAIGKNIVEKMGPCPKYRAHPNIGKSGLFIGDCVRFDMLAKLGKADVMLRELKDVFYKQLQEGPGTLWENEVVEATSRCHGFNAHVGVHLTRDILGMNAVDELSKTVKLTPNPCDLRWARGVQKTKNGCMSVSFVNVDDRFELKATVPSCYECVVELPSYIKGLGDDNIKIDVKYV